MVDYEYLREQETVLAIECGIVHATQTTINHNCRDSCVLAGWGVWSVVEAVREVGGEGEDEDGRRGQPDQQD